MNRADTTLDFIGSILWCAILLPILAALYVFGGFWRDDRADQRKERD
jgi:hypothetical protein